MERQKVVTRSEITSPQIVPKRHSDFAPEIVKPLGYIETADGQKKAIIGEGEWIQLVAEGQTLPDGSRVAKVTSTSVEIFPGNEAKVASLKAELPYPEAVQVEAASAVPEASGSEVAAAGIASDPADAVSVAGVEESPKEPEVASVHNEARLPHEVDAEASLAPGWHLPPAGPEPRLVELGRPTPPRPTSEGALPPSAVRPLAGPSQPLGFVQKADGTTLTVMSDGDSVRLEAQPLVASVAPPSLPVDLPRGMGREVPAAPSWLASRPTSFGGSGTAIGPLATVEALGYVERADGRVQAILDQGDSVQLVEEGQLLADGSRVVGITPTSVTVAFGSGEPLSGLPSRKRDLPVAATATGGMLSQLRAPPIETRPATPEPEPRARGMPAMASGRSAYSRPPPEHAARDWIEEQSPEQPTEKPELAATTCGSLSASSRGGGSLARLARREGVVCLGRASDTDVDGLSTPSEHSSIRPLGFVEWPSGRIQAIVSRGDGVEFLEEGQTLADGSRVVAVSRDAVELSRSSAASSGRLGTSFEQVTATGGFPTVPPGARDGIASTEQAVRSAGIPGDGIAEILGFAGEVPGTSLEPVEDNGLQLNWPVRDNRDEPLK